MPKLHEMNAQAPVAPDLWTQTGDPQLIGGRRKSDGEIVFPMPDGDAAQHYDRTLLARCGILWSWTVQSFRPKTPPYDGPADFVPFALGYVELPGEVIIETRLTQISNLSIGMAVELVIVPYNETSTTFAFRPVGDQA